MIPSHVVNRNGSLNVCPCVISPLSTISYASAEEGRPFNRDLEIPKLLLDRQAQTATRADGCKTKDSWLAFLESYIAVNGYARERTAELHGCSLFGKRTESSISPILE